MNKDFKAVWLSDVHLGTPHCKANALSYFLENYSCEKLYLVGDIIDGWMIKDAGLFWPNSHNNVIRKLLEKSENQNTEVIYIPGNHDEFIREYANEYALSLGKIKIRNEDYYTTINGKKLWIVHGDYWDILIKAHKSLSNLGTIGKLIPYVVNKSYVYMTKRKKRGKTNSSKIAKKFKRLIEFVDRYETLLARETKKRNCDGVVCGHIHHPQIKNVKGIDYFNCGDWVGSCTAIVEKHDGTINLLQVLENELTTEDKKEAQIKTVYSIDNLKSL